MKLFDGLHAFLWTDPATNNANTYFIDGEKRILLDPGHARSFGRVREHLNELGLSTSDVDLVIITHAHPDHMEALRFFYNTATVIAFPELELDCLKAESRSYGAFAESSKFQPHILLREGRLQVGNHAFDVYFTPGHSPGSICIYWRERQVLFTGDVVFRQGVGRTDLPGGSGRDLKESILKLSQLDVECLLPGHGDVVTGRDAVKANFEEIRKLWFSYL